MRKLTDGGSTAHPGSRCWERRSCPCSHPRGELQPSASVAWGTRSQLAPAGTLRRSPREVPERSFCVNSTACRFSSVFYSGGGAEGARRGRLTCRVTDWDLGPRSLGPAHGGDAPAPALRGASRRSLRGHLCLGARRGPAPRLPAPCSRISDKRPVPGVLPSFPPRPGGPAHPASRGRRLLAPFPKTRYR